MTLRRVHASDSGKFTWRVDKKTDVMNSGLIADLRRIVGSPNVSVNREDIDRYSGDALGVYRAFGGAHRLSAQPSVLTWPTDSQQVSQVLRFAQRHQVPTVPYGGGTGVMGAATASDGCIVLNLQRMNTILDISKEDLTAHVQAGTILEAVAAALEQSDLVFGHDPWSRPIATVGGAISTNGVGYTAAAHGSMGQQVLGLEVVLADGEVVQTKKRPRALLRAIVEPSVHWLRRDAGRYHRSDSEGISEA